MSGRLNWVRERNRNLTSVSLEKAKITRNGRRRSSWRRKRKKRKMKKTRSLMSLLNILNVSVVKSSSTSTFALLTLVVVPAVVEALVVADAAEIVE